LALLLSAMGIYALISYSVSERTREIGVRVALGAQRGSVLRMVLREGLKLLIFGLLLGWVGAFLATRVMRSLLYSTSATDAVSFVATSIYADRRRVAGLLYSSSPSHQGGSDDRIAIRVDLGSHAFLRRHFWSVWSALCAVSVPDLPRHDGNLWTDCLNAKSRRSAWCKKGLNSTGTLIQTTTTEAPQGLSM
jgi:ABC-type antimicrobial peptide transport system permease subunit